MPQLTVYRASAGSGKTFTLATRFIALLVKEPTAYKEILAVTFTVKATAEMKERVLCQLYGLCHALPDSEAYLQQITASLAQQHIALSEKEVRRRAGIALQLILHDYSNFNVETIDSFFQRILRNLARELDLNANLRVELNDSDIEALAVDRLISDLKDDDTVLRWVMDFVKNRLSDEKDWNVVKEIKEFGKKIFSHEYKEYSAAINETLRDDTFVEAYQEALRAARDAATDEMTAVGQEFLALLTTHGYTVDDFAHKGSGPAGFLARMSMGQYLDAPKVNVTKALASSDGWLTKSNKDGAKRAFVEETLFPLLRTTEERRQACTKQHNTAIECLKHLNELRLLHSIEQIVKDINADANRFLLSDTQTILHSMMDGDDTPFVFEKIGGRIRHIMIDEFQDTSTVQWDNFKKLLLNCMAQRDAQNLVVGDVKQSIYRWRNSDWRLLNDIERDPALADKEIETIVLDKNYRSERNIIAFNNAFFTLAPQIESDTLAADGNKRGTLVKDIYAPALTQQALPAAKASHGLVDIRLLPATTVAAFEALCLGEIQQHIETLLAAGARESDIAILVRENRHATLVGNSLKEVFPTCMFVSDEAFQLSSSVAVSIIVGAMKVLHNSRDLFTRTQLAVDYHLYVLRDNTQILIDRHGGAAAVDQWLPPAFTSNERALRALPLSDMAEALCLLFDIEKLDREAAYVNAFFDALASFAQTGIPDLDSFVEYWDSVMFKKTVKGGDIQGIRLLTIHKAKGLEFDHVIVPFCDWKLDKGSTLWIAPQEEPFSALPVVPLDSTHLKETLFADAYHEEKLQNTVDNLNLLYVAFTRAKKNLFVIGRNAGKKAQSKGPATEQNIDFARRSGLLQAVLPMVAETLGTTFSGDRASREAVLHFTFGSLYVQHAAKKTSDNIFLQEKVPLTIDMRFARHKVEFRQSNSSRVFVASPDDDSAERAHYLSQGTLCHNILARIHHLSDVERVLNEFMAEGVVSAADKDTNRESIAAFIRQRIEQNRNPLVREWFADEAQVLNECAILTRDAATGQVRTLRPDRVVRQGNTVVVVDFKFAHPREEHRQQVSTYMRLLRAMGYDEVRGYLWYGYTNKIEEIK